MAVGEIVFAKEVVDLSSKRETIERIIHDIDARREFDRHERRFIRRAFSDFLVALKMLEEKTGAREIVEEET